LSAWRQLLGAEWIDCHQVADLTTTGNSFTDPQSLTGMGLPTSRLGHAELPLYESHVAAVSGIQIDGYFPDACNAFQAEPALTAKDGSPFIPAAPRRRSWGRPASRSVTTMRSSSSASRTAGTDIF